MGWDEWFQGVTSYATQQATASGVVAAQAGGASGRLVAPAGNSRGIPFRNGVDLEGSLAGRLSIGLVGAVILFLAFSYIMSRNVQGGG